MNPHDDLRQHTPQFYTSHQTEPLPTPTINKDDTVTLLAEGKQRLKLQGEQKTTEGAIVLANQQLGQVILNLHDGETMAIEGKTLAMGERPPLDQGHTSTTKTIVFLTARIVRRVGD